MAKSELKTKQNDKSVKNYLDSISDIKRRKDALRACKIMADVTGESPVMWGSSIIGFGKYEYVYASGREGTWMKIGLSPRKNSLTLYIMNGFSGYQGLMTKLGPHSTGKSCLYIKDLDDVDESVLREIIKSSYASNSAGEI